MRHMKIENSELGYGKYILNEFEFEYGRTLKGVQVEYTTRGTPKYDDEGNIVNAVIYCHKFNGNHASIDDLYQLIGNNGALSDYGFFYISITSLGFPESCSPSVSKLKYDFPQYSIKDCVNFKRQFLAEKFNITHVLGIAGSGVGGYEVYTWACEYPDEMDFIILGSSSYKTNGYRYVSSKIMDAMIDSADAYYDDNYSESLFRVMISINRLMYSNNFSKQVFQNMSRDEIDVLMDDFVDQGLFVDIYDFKFRNDAVLVYDVEEKLENIKAKTLIISFSEDIYHPPEYDIYPLKGKIENLKIHIFDSKEYHTSEDDYSIATDVLLEFLEEFKQ
ncbi:alpha/beta fold hydrolase [uncultured Methanobrevibacter sp.]|uniref:alpha/beta fold hydrolase n=1 Tax=uncultured Methanobrevibacter sp. TaxID=253161 RepID=UPI0025D07613|nr:alpha/beta fold hydrolase [uncultured Methanobrevibacter sp.]